MNSHGGLCPGCKVWKVPWELRREKSGGEGLSGLLRRDGARAITGLCGSLAQDRAQLPWASLVWAPLFGARVLQWALPTEYRSTLPVCMHVQFLVLFLNSHGPQLSAFVF